MPFIFVGSVNSDITDISFPVFKGLPVYLMTAGSVSQDSRFTDVFIGAMIYDHEISLFV